MTPMNTLVLISNNPRVTEQLSQFDQEPCDSYQQVLLKARDRIHGGARLLTHPLAGSVKPGESPYRSVAVSKETGALHMPSLDMIESSIDRFNTLTSTRENRVYPAETLEDFQLIDYNLIRTGLDAMISRL